MSDSVRDGPVSPDNEADAGGVGTGGTGTTGGDGGAGGIGGDAAHEAGSVQERDGGRESAASSVAPSDAGQARRAVRRLRFIPYGRRRGDSESPAAVPVAGLVAGAWAVVAGLVPVATLVLVAWATAGVSAAPAGSALRAAGSVWLLAHGVPVRTGSGPLGLAPLAISGYLLWQLVRAGRVAVRATGGGAAALPDPTAAGQGAAGQGAAGPGATGTASGVIGVVGWIAATYGVGGALVGLLAGRGAGATVAAVACAGIAMPAAGVGAVWEAVPRQWLTGRLSLPAATGVRAGVAALMTLLVGGSALLAAGLATSWPQGTELYRSYGDDPVAGAGLTLVSLAFLPNAVVWAAAYGAGPGFAMGVGTLITPMVVELGPVPALPLLAALPVEPQPVALLVGPLAGVVAGLVLRRHSRHARTLPELLTPLGYATLSAAVGALAMAAVSGGPLGDGRLAAAGPSPWRLGLVFGLEVLLAAGLIQLLRVRLLRRASLRGIRRRVLPRRRRRER